MCGQTADLNNRRATPSANDEGRERKRYDRAARLRESKTTIAFVMIFGCMGTPRFSPEDGTPGIARRSIRMICTPLSAVPAPVPILGRPGVSTQHLVQLCRMDTKYSRPNGQFKRVYLGLNA
jgi:hypothetical protein